MSTLCLCFVVLRGVARSSACPCVLVCFVGGMRSDQVAVAHGTGVRAYGVACHVDRPTLPCLPAQPMRCESTSPIAPRCSRDKEGKEARADGHGQGDGTAWIAVLRPSAGPSACPCVGVWVRRRGMGCVGTERSWRSVRLSHSTGTLALSRSRSARSLVCLLSLSSLSPSPPLAVFRVRMLCVGGVSLVRRGLVSRRVLRPAGHVAAERHVEHNSGFPPSERRRREENGKAGG